MLPHLLPQQRTRLSVYPLVLESESVASVSSTDATLEAQINPNGQNDWAQLQLVEEASLYASEILCPESGSPGFSGCIGNRSATALPLEFAPGNAAHPEAFDVVSLDLASAGVTLKPGTTYHYRVLAAPAVQTEDTIQWEEPTVFGQDETFTTLSLPPIESGPIPAPPLPQVGWPDPLFPGCLRHRHRHHQRHGHHRHHHRERCRARK